MNIYLGTIHVDNGLYEGYQIPKLIYAKDNKEAQSKLTEYIKHNYPGSTGNIDDPII